MSFLALVPAFADNGYGFERGVQARFFAILST